MTDLTVLTIAPAASPFPPGLRFDDVERGRLTGDEMVNPAVARLAIGAWQDFLRRMLPPVAPDAVAPVAQPWSDDGHDLDCLGAVA